MMKNNGISLFMVLLLSFFAAYKTSSFECASTQFLEYQKTGIIKCSSERQFYGIYWYNSTDSASNPPFLYSDRSQENGNTHSVRGYEILESGSLLIENVSLRDEHLHRAVLILDESSGQIEIRDINVIVVAKPEVSYPVINYCLSERFCFAEMENNATLKCFVQDSKPAVSLKWCLRTAWNETDILSEAFISEGETWFTSSTYTNAIWPQRLSLLVCKVVYPPGMLLNGDSFILVENKSAKVQVADRKTLYVELGAQMILICPLGRKHVFKWAKILENGTERSLAFAYLSEHGLTKAIQDHRINSNGDLIIDRSKIQHEGLYWCIFSDGLNDEGAEVDVLIYANPEPPFPLVQGCETYALRHCVLHVKKQGILTCSLHRIRPVVQLEFGVFLSSKKDLISFSDHQVVTENEDGTFNIILTSGYTLQHESRGRLTVQCGTVDSNSNFSTVFDLHFMNASCIRPTATSHTSEEGEVIVSSPPDEETNFDRNILWILLPIGLFLMLLVLLALKICCLSKIRRLPPSQTEEVLPMLQGTQLQTSKHDIFTRQLRKKYEKLYDSILPVPFWSDEKYCVNNVFVESALEFQMPQKKSEWTRLNSYKDLSTINNSGQKRLLVLGEPGIGKSTLTLQMAYDWCNQEKGSPMKNVDILILLRLRQLKCNHTMYEFIKLLLLPIDTTLTTHDIESILQTSNSVCIILDGFDEYVDQEVTACVDIENVIRGDMLQNVQVLVCTRPSCWPKELPPQTSHIRMKGFDDTAQEQYIAKAITRNSVESTNHIKEKLKENTILLDFCEIPLFFVMYAHLTNKSDVIHNLSSVTGFFRYIISCFYSHYDNKTTNKGSFLSTNFKENYKPISKVAFDGLFGEHPKIVWDKPELETIIGNEYYEKYIEIGILVEEQVLTVTDQPGTSSAKHVCNKTEVRFYHKLFCEWYAAHHVADLALSAIEVDFLSILDKVNDTDQHYTFRFACGINPKCADKIIKFLTKNREEDRLAILCLLEKTGNFETIKEEISGLCEKQISLSKNDPRIVQRSTAQLLEIASKNKIPIFNVCLRGCYEKINIEREQIVLTSGIFIPKLGTLGELEIFAEEKDFNLTEVKDLMAYCWLCRNVRTLRLKYCLLPKRIQVKNLKEQATCVIWAPNLFRTYILDNQSGFWKDRNGRQLDETAYLEEVTSFRTERQ